MRLIEKVCIITGAGSGIGRATALLFAREGGRVVVADIDEPAARQVMEEIIANDRVAIAYRMDVTDPQQCLQLVDAIKERFGRIDVLFNNAGISGVGTVHEASLELWDRVMDVNVRGVFLVSRAVIPHMIAQRSGCIINMSSAVAQIGLARRAPYAASKGAVLALTKSMQVDYAPYNIRVNALLPGTILTAFVDRYLRESYTDYEEGLASIRRRQLTKELGRPEDVSEAALFLASDESRFVLGSGLIVDGGLTSGR